MKKILILLIASLAMLMADFTLEGDKLTPTNTINNTVTDPVPSPTGSAKTNWGFQPFSIPSDSVTVPVGGDIQAAINSLPNGGTVYLEAGTHYANNILLKSNIVLQGAGINNTTVKYTSLGAPTDASLIRAHASNGANPKSNIILRDFKADCTGMNANTNGIEFIYGVDNILVENLEVFGAVKSNLLVYNTSWTNQTDRVTMRNIYSHDSYLMHGIALRFVQGAVIESCNFHDIEGVAIDLSRVKYGEIANCDARHIVQGMKFPGSSYIYIHDNFIQDTFDSTRTANGAVGIKFNYLCEETNLGKQYFHLENNIVDNTVSGVVDWGDTCATPTFQEIVFKGNSFVNNVDGGSSRNTARLRGANASHEYGDNIGISEVRAGVINVIEHPTSTPEEDGVGYTSWGNP